MPGYQTLATDLDGTLIPLEGNPTHQADLQALASELTRHELGLLYLTGRHFSSVMDAINQYKLPLPQWLFCDVGTSLYKREPRNDRFSAVSEYTNDLTLRTSQINAADLRRHFETNDALRLQESEKQTTHKLSYYADQKLLPELSDRLAEQLVALDLPYSIVSSVDPFTGDGLIDFLPSGVAKGFALKWWLKHIGKDLSTVIFAGDSGNDVDAFATGVSSILVANASKETIAAAKAAHAIAGVEHRIYEATQKATSGVLAGLRHYLNR